LLASKPGISRVCKWGFCAKKLLSLAGFKSSLGTGDFSEVCIYGRRKREEGRRKKEEGRRKKEKEKRI
jgi:hypothetical protein